MNEDLYNRKKELIAGVRAELLDLAKTKKEELYAWAEINSDCKGKPVGIEIDSIGNPIVLWDYYEGLSSVSVPSEVLFDENIMQFIEEQQAERNLSQKERQRKQDLERLHQLAAKLGKEVINQT